MKDNPNGPTMHRLHVRWMCPAVGCIVSEQGLLRQDFQGEGHNFKVDIVDGQKIKVTWTNVKVSDLALILPTLGHTQAY